MVSPVANEEKTPTFSHPLSSNTLKHIERHWGIDATIEEANHERVYDEFQRRTRKGQEECGYANNGGGYLRH